MSQFQTCVEASRNLGAPFHPALFSGLSPESGSLTGLERGASRCGVSCFMPYKDKDRQRAYQRVALHKVRKDWFEANGPCVKCGSWDSLELDHIDPATKTAHRIWSWKPSERERELAKCQVLCAKCHKAKTIAEHTKPLVHGTANGYKGKACRCAECRAWNAARMRRQLARKRATPENPAAFSHGRVPGVSS